MCTDQHDCTASSPKRTTPEINLITSAKGTFSSMGNGDSPVCEGTIEGRPVVQRNRDRCSAYQDAHGYQQVFLGALEFGQRHGVRCWLGSIARPEALLSPHLVPKTPGSRQQGVR